MDTAASALLILNRTSGTGAAPTCAAALRAVLARRLPATIREVEDHPTAALAAEAFVRAHPSALLVVAGGGGTLRAAAEGAWRAVGRRSAPPQRLSMAALRLGSGNVVARALGAGRDPVQSLERLAAAHGAGRTVAVPLIRCRADGREHLALAMAGFARWGLVPGDIARWRRAAGRARCGLGRAVGIEHLNQLEYRTFFALRLLQALADPRCLRPVELTAGGRTTRLRPLAMGVVNLPVRGLPGVRPPALAEPRFDLYVLPWPGAGRPRLAWTFRPGAAPVRLRMLDGAPAECFLDEDPERGRDLLLDLPGFIHFASGGTSK
ncbi:MAG TPA: diacylglycerol kinase family protein [Terriglobales bacterium]|nr:diacylglycerol kinase family protein [Terriglobales bacterium]